MCASVCVCACVLGVCACGVCSMCLCCVCECGVCVSVVCVHVWCVFVRVCVRVWLCDDVRIRFCVCVFLV